MNSSDYLIKYINYQNLLKKYIHLNHYSRFEFDFRTRAMSYCSTVEELYNLSDILIERQNAILITCKTDKDRIEALKQSNGILHYMLMLAKKITHPSTMSNETTQPEVTQRPTLIIPTNTRTKFKFNTKLSASNKI